MLGMYRTQTSIPSETAVEMPRGQNENTYDGSEQQYDGQPDGSEMQGGYTGMPSEETQSLPVSQSTLTFLSNGLALPTREAVSETIYWSGIMKEHMDYYFMLLDRNSFHGQELQELAKQLSEEWEKLRVSLRHGDSIYVPALDALMVSTGQYKSTLVDKIRAREWIGAIYESLVLETLKELQLFADILTGASNWRDEIVFWNMHSRDHALVNAHLLDPSAKKDFTDNLRAALEFDTLMGSEGDQGPEAWIASTLLKNEQFLGLVRAAYARSQVSGKAGLSSTIPEALFEHTIKEILYGLRRIAMLSGMDSNLPQYLEDAIANLLEQPPAVE